ncbi:MAG: Fic family protein [Gemmatimonadaceae bacterium]
MARKSASVDEELEILESLIGARSAGLSRAELERAFAETQERTIAERTLSRRLERLASEHRISVVGNGPSTLYALGKGAIASAPMVEAGYVPLTLEGARVRQLVRRPIVEKRPVGYDPALLQKYRPGKTWYLPLAARERLHSLGCTPDETRPAGTYAREIFGRLLIDLAWASSRLEGNTYSRLDTQNLIEFGQRAEGKDVAESQMILNHKEAIELLVDDAEHVGFNRYTFLNLHAALAENLLSNSRDEGRLREMPVQITGTPYVPTAIPQKIEEYFDQFLAIAAAIPDPFEQSFFTMVHVPYLQPFTDVNKRTSRLASNISLFRANLCPLSFVDVPEQAYVEGLLGVYELRRIELLRDVFTWAYERSCAQYTVVRESLGQPDSFRLRYRTQLAAAVKETVVRGDAPRRETLRAWADVNGIPAADNDRFSTTALELLLELHEHSAARYRLRPTEFLEWRARFPSAPVVRQNPRP